MNKQMINEIFERVLDRLKANNDVMILVDGKERIGMSELGINLITK